MKILITLITLLICSMTFAGESGFIYNGKTYIVYRDGEKVGKTMEELGLGEPKSTKKRKPSSFSNNRNVEITFQTDNLGNTCYYFAYTNGDSISCVRK